MLAARHLFTTLLPSPLAGEGPGVRGLPCRIPDAGTNGATPLTPTLSRKGRGSPFGLVWPEREGGLADRHVKMSGTPAPSPSLPLKREGAPAGAY
ncbi:hypothetical protein XFLAVUS301_39090 [Xanthobacter flavus]|uniref:Uncharacterized protein n=1 Tax=Xanthobacter flavus TaxID=281 RepID=A0A9W6CPQ5_XANFL|nr:hypothetical protein XFLAVUS301_39090 [Xanthobacter flavus]